MPNRSSATNAHQRDVQIETVTNHRESCMFSGMKLALERLFNMLLGVAWPGFVCAALAL